MKFFFPPNTATAAAERLSGLKKSKRYSPHGKKLKRRNKPLTSHPSLVLINANIITMDLSHPTAEAVAIHQDQIIDVGNSRDISKLAGSETILIDLHGRTVLPGFIDCHCHLIEFGLSLKSLDVRGTQTIRELKKRLQARGRELNGWITGRGWDQEKFAEARYPNRYDLDDAVKHKPVFLRRICGHIAVANTAALRSAGINSRTPDPPGGKIDHDTAGRTTGILRETAMDLVEEKIPQPTLSEYKAASLVAFEKALAVGLTTVHCIISSKNELSALQELEKEDKLPIRIHVLIPIHKLKFASQLGIRTGLGNDWLRIGAMKIFTDGSLGARTAALSAPYSDDPLNRGILTYKQEELEKLIEGAHTAGFQVAAHAIGDEATRVVLRCYRKLRNREKMRHRIEHASVLSPNLIRCISKLNLIVSVQPSFIRSDTWIESRLGSRRSRYANALRTLKQRNVMTVAGSDCPVEPLSPLIGICAAVDRSGAQSLTVDDAISLYTRNAAYVTFEEHAKGSVEVGKFADLVVLGNDPREVPASNISRIRVLMTIVGGKISYDSLES